VSNDFHKAKEIADWKRKVSRVWDSIEVLSVQQFNLAKERMLLGKNYDIQVQLDIDTLDNRDIGVELVLADQESDRMKIKEKIPFACTEQKGGMATYVANFMPEKSGIYFAGIRFFATNENLPHRQDFALVRWI
jgi:phosphorylase/glycogen(starch) synthase